MVFTISDDDSIKPEESVRTQEKSGFANGLAKSAVKIAAVPAARVIEKVSKLPGALIEAPSALTQGVYGLVGKEPPEWTYGPSGIRLNERGEIRPGLETPEEAREMYTKPALGKYTEPMNVVEEKLSEAGEIAGDLLTAGIGRPAKIAKGVGAAMAVRGVSEFSGIHPFFSIPAEAILTHAYTTSKGHPGSYSKKGKELLETAKREGITEIPSSVLKEGEKDPVGWFLKKYGLASQSVRDQAQKFVGQIEDAFHSVLSDIHNPYQAEKDISLLKKEAGKLFEPVKKLALENPVPLNTKPLLESIDKNINLLKKSQSLTESEKKALNILQDFRSEVSSGTNLDQAEASYRSFQKHIKDWDSITKNDAHLISVQKKLSEEMLNSGKSVPGFNEAFDLSNIAYHNVKNLETVLKFLSPSFSETGSFQPKKFVESVRNKTNRSKLIEILGKENFNRLHKIADLSEAASKQFSEVGAMLPEDLRISNKQIGSKMGLISSIGNMASSFIGQGIAAKILTSPAMQENYIGYLHALNRNKPKLVAYWIQQMKKDIQPEKETQSGFTISD